MIFVLFVQLLLPTSGPPFSAAGGVGAEPHFPHFPHSLARLLPMVLGGSGGKWEGRRKGVFSCSSLPLGDDWQQQTALAPASSFSPWSRPLFPVLHSPSQVLSNRSSLGAAPPQGGWSMHLQRELWASALLSPPRKSWFLEIPPLPICSPAQQ